MCTLAEQAIASHAGHISLELGRVRQDEEVAELAAFLMRVALGLDTPDCDRIVLLLNAI